MILRLEQYLARVAGGTGAIPENPETNTEAYLAILAGENRQAPEPITRLDMYLYNLIGGNYPIPTPNTRIEQYLAKACGLEIEVPTPITREEQLWYAIAQSSWQLTTLTGTLPLSFKSKGEALTDYKLYGTSDGAGVETESGEPTGYKLPMTVESGEESTTTPIYIGDSKLMAEEYVDYESGKVWKLRDNLFDAEKIVEDSTSIASIYISDGWLRYNTGPYPITINVNGQVGERVQFKLYIKNFNSSSSNNMRFDLYYSDGTSVTTASNSYAAGISRYTQFASNPDKELVFIVSSNTSNRNAGIDISKSLIVKSDTMPETYLNPTDLPVTLPEISTHQGENTLSCSEGLGECSITGYIKEAGNG